MNTPYAGINQISYKGWQMPLSPNVGTPGDVVKVNYYLNIVKKRRYALQLLQLHIHQYKLS
jgi:hypothetical protein